MYREIVHKYYCGSCLHFIYGATTERLASEVNHHNRVSHPMDAGVWNATTITHSKHYTGPENEALPQYTKPYGTTTKGDWGGIPAPTVTDEDHEFLESIQVKWDADLA
jgi:hypothetical protein